MIPEKGRCGHPSFPTARPRRTALSKSRLPELNLSEGFYFVLKFEHALKKAKPRSKTFHLEFNLKFQHGSPILEPEVSAAGHHHHHTTPIFKKKTPLEPPDPMGCETPL